MYKTFYDWTDSTYSGFANFLKYLYEVSYNYYEKNWQKLGDKEKYSLKLKEFVQNIEHYLHFLIRLGYVNKDNLYDVLRKIMSIKLIRLLGNDEKFYVGYTEDNVVSLNPNMSSNATLTKEERELLYSSHEFGHVVNSRWSNDALAVSKNLWNSNELRTQAQKYGFNSLKYFMHGIKLIDEVITEDVAENVAYAYAEKKRPCIKYVNNNLFFNGKSYLSNFDIYGDFQEIAVKFAQLLDFLKVTKNASYEEVLYKLSRESMHKDFLRRIVLDIFRESAKNRDNNIDFYLMVCCLGLLKDAHYQLVNINDFSDSKARSSSTLQLFNDLSTAQLQKRKKVY